MDKTKVIKKYKDKAKQEARWLLADGNIVIGEEADEENHLNYVVQDKDGNINMIRASGIKPMQNFIIPKETIVVLKQK